MSKSQIENLVGSFEGMRAYQQERVILDTTERMCEVMEEKKITRKRLADRLGTSKSFVTQLLDGRRNMTLRTLSDVFLALGFAVHIQTGSLAASVKSSVELSVDVTGATWSEANEEWDTESNVLISCPPVDVPDGIAA
jgi:transcriptional regulator with XRE-family HTH domain